MARIIGLYKATTGLLHPLPRSHSTVTVTWCGRFQFGCLLDSPNLIGNGVTETFLGIPISHLRQSFASLLRFLPSKRGAGLLGDVIGQAVKDLLIPGVPLA
jgi:hypothetical protein